MLEPFQVCLSGVWEGKRSDEVSVESVEGDVVAGGEGRVKRRLVGSEGEVVMGEVAGEMDVVDGDGWCGSLSGDIYFSPPAFPSFLRGCRALVSDDFRVFPSSVSLGGSPEDVFLVDLRKGMMELGFVAMGVVSMSASGCVWRLGGVAFLGGVLQGVGISIGSG